MALSHLTIIITVLIYVYIHILHMPFMFVTNFIPCSIIYNSDKVVLMDLNYKWEFYHIAKVIK